MGVTLPLPLVPLPDNLWRVEPPTPAGGPYELVVWEHFDQRPHPGMEATLEVVIPDTEISDLDTIPRGKSRSSGTLRGQSQSDVVRRQGSPTKSRYLSKSMVPPP